MDKIIGNHTSPLVSQKSLQLGGYFHGVKELLLASRIEAQVPSPIGFAASVKV